jgi:hypothetical protein
MLLGNLEERRAQMTTETAENKLFLEQKIAEAAAAKRSR